MAEKTTTMGRSRPVPERSADFDHLSLGALRRYRQALTTEESRVSYWRRIIQARLDLVQAAIEGLPQSVDTLRGVLAQEGLGSGRRALVEVLPTDDMPPLPDLQSLWAQDPVAGDERHNKLLAAELAKAERQLSAYRAALHRRLAGATGELIARYREDPLQCLSVLPTQPTAARRVAGL